jgi:hypothetical protein
VVLKEVVVIAAVCAASDHIYCQARMEARHNCSKSGFSVHNYTSIGEVWFWVQKKGIDQIEARTQDLLRISCSIVELVLVEGELPL